MICNFLCEKKILVSRTPEARGGQRRHHLLLAVTRPSCLLLYCRSDQYLTREPGARQWSFVKFKLEELEYPGSLIFLNGKINFLLEMQHNSFITSTNLRQHVVANKPTNKYKRCMSSHKTILCHRVFFFWPNPKYFSADSAAASVNGGN